MARNTSVAGSPDAASAEGATVERVVEDVATPEDLLCSEGEVWAFAEPATD
jgi:hypothetical protein